ncbi:glycosyltransferase [Candidatus Pacearchaeota archaeon]|nr:glycosyltransferase [Candidatus Pacearchaeota archaeon]
MSKTIIDSQGIYSPLGDGIVTGFSKAAGTMAKHLAKNFDVSYIATDYTGLPFEYDGYTVYHGNADYNCYELNQHITQYDYDNVIYIGEPWGAQNYNNIEFGNTKTIFHLPTDGLPLDTHLTNVKNSFDLIIPMSKFGKMSLEYAGIQCSDAIPLSYNSKYYKQLSQVKRNALREELDIKDKFVVNFVGRVQARKNLMSMLVSFAQFAKDKEDVILLLTITIDEHADFDILQLIQTLRVDDKVKIIQMQRGSMLSDEELGQIYSASDVYLSTSCSEGFNMPVMESIACGTPAIVSKYSAHIELVAQHGELIDIEYYKAMNNNANWAYVSTNDTVAKLNKLYNDRELLSQYSKDGLQFISAYKDSVVQPMWNDVLNNINDKIEQVECRKPVRSMSL